MTLAEPVDRSVQWTGVLELTPLVLLISLSREVFWPWLWLERVVRREDGTEACFERGCVVAVFVFGFACIVDSSFGDSARLKGSLLVEEDI